MPKPVALVTGSNSGLGKSLSIKLAENGYIVYASMRNLAKSAELLDAAKLANVEVIACELDVTKPSTIEDCVNQVLTDQARIDVLINNAGAGFVRTTEQASEEEVQWVMDLNFHGVVRCTRAVLPAMRQAKSGHIINITSVGGLVGQPFNEIYCAAKFAVEGYTESMATYVQPNFGVKFTAIEPGGITSEFASSALAQFASTGGMRDDDYKPVLEHYIGAAQARAGSAKDVYQSPEQVAQLVIDCINNPEPPIRMRTSEWAEGFTRLKTSADPDGKLLQQYVIDTLM